jgi:hypothetical protein
MKKIVSVIAVIFCLLFFADRSYAQGNLQFNQVILFTVPANTTVAFTVPAGKVWKIESIGVGGASSTSVVLRDGSANMIAYLLGTTNASQLPFWLPESFSGSFQSTGTNPYRDVVSIIEFNVVP